MSNPGKQQLYLEHPRTKDKPVFVIPHGHYRGAYPDTVTSDEARKALGVRADEFIAMFFGEVRAYKGAAHLIRCFVKAEIPNTRLFVVGKADSNNQLELRDAATHAASVNIFPDFVADDKIQNFLRAADFVILPFKEILNSGSAILALSFDRPILVPARGAMAELREIAGPDWVRLYEGELTPEIIRDAVRWTKERQIARGARAPIEALNWDRIAQLTIEAFSNVLKNPEAQDRV